MFQGKIRRAALAALCALAMAAGAPAGVAGSLPDRERLEIALDGYSEEQVARAAYDAGAEMGRVDFFSAGTAGGGQTVWLGDDGVTRLVVYGE